VSFWKKLFHIGENPNSAAYRMEQAAKISGQAVKYVTERKDDNDDIVGRGGSVTAVDNKLIIDSSGERLFISEIRDVDISWLMSGNGVIISGPNELEDGRHRALTVHFVYYRK